MTHSTPAALDALASAGLSPIPLIERHASGDWGDICVEDQGLNDDAILDGTRLFSVYRVLPDGGAVWIITEADREHTTALLPDEY